MVIVIDAKDAALAAPVEIDDLDDDGMGEPMPEPVTLPMPGSWKHPDPAWNSLIAPIDDLDTELDSEAVDPSDSVAIPDVGMAAEVGDSAATAPIPPDWPVEDVDYIPPPRKAKGSISAAFERGANLAPPPAELPGGPTPREQGGSRVARRPSPASRAKTAGRPPGADLISDLFNTGIILCISFGVGEWALPTEEEARDISIPLGNIIARRIDLAARLGKDADDVIALLIASAIYASRVAPLAVDRTRNALAERRRSERLAERSADGPGNANGTNGMAPGTNAAESASLYATPGTTDALAKARRIGLGSLGISVGDDPRRVAAVGH